jgi:two-component system chemotaxis response regulator CheY
MTNPKDLNFLVVDDFEPMRNIVCGLLRETGYEHCEKAEDGEVALEKLKAAKFDFVITDINMPRLNGFQLLDAIKADASLRHLPVLLMTDSVRPEELRKAAEKGASLITKPFTRATLEDRITRILQRLPAR